MTPALLALADGRGTNEAHLTAIYLAKMINREMGGVLVGPWDVYDLPEEWIDAFRGLAVELPGIRAGRKRAAEAVAELKKAHGWQ